MAAVAGTGLGWPTRRGLVPFVVSVPFPLLFAMVDAHRPGDPTTSRTRRPMADVTSLAASTSPNHRPKPSTVRCPAMGRATWFSANGMSPVATLVERSTRFVTSWRCPMPQSQNLVADALAGKITTTLPAAYDQNPDLGPGQGHSRPACALRSSSHRSRPMGAVWGWLFDFSRRRSASDLRSGVASLGRVPTILGFS